MLTPLPTPKIVSEIVFDTLNSVGDRNRVYATARIFPSVIPFLKVGDATFLQQLRDASFDRVTREWHVQFVRLRSAFTIPDPNLINSDVDYGSLLGKCFDF